MRTQTRPRGAEQRTDWDAEGSQKTRADAARAVPSARQRPGREEEIEWPRTRIAH